jgi:phosphatidate cytidylyltransferase
MSTIEFLNIIKTNHLAKKSLICISMSLFFFINIHKRNLLFFIYSLIFFTFINTIYLLKLNKKDFFKITSLSFFLIYIGIGLFSGYLLLIYETKYETNVGIHLLILCIIPISFNDSFSYIFGKMLGKKKIFPNISPKKTLEGYIYGSTSSVLLTIILFLYLKYRYIHYFYFISKSNLILLILILTLLAPIGDLLESKLKRIFLKKDSGSILPGHGGLLDRLDSALLCFPCALIYILSIKSCF